MKIIQENEYLDTMKNEVEPYLKAHCREGYIPGAEDIYHEKNGIIGKIHVKRYLADDPKGVVVISHGFTEGAPKYEEMIYYFLQAGYHVYMPEHMGHGQSYRLTADPSLVYIDIWKRYVRDFLKVCHEIKRVHPDLPLNLFAHSMGGAISAIAAAWEPALFHKVILSSPMIKPLTGGVPWPLTVLIAHAECVLGKEESYVLGQKPYDGTDTFQTSAGTSESKFARYNDLRKEKQFLQTCAPSYGWLKAAIKMSWYLRYHGWKKLRSPLLIFQAEKDDFISVRALQKFAAKIRKRGVAPCEYVYMPGTKHEIYCGGDETMEVYWDKIEKFLEEK